MQIFDKIKGDMEMLKMKPTKRNEAGFTLVEIAIVMVIIGS
jgi:prepilin-type N-terminal cleavage/methylation domain-containing protein